MSVIKKVLQFFKWECVHDDDRIIIYDSWHNFKDNLFTGIILFIIIPLIIRYIIIPIFFLR